MRKKKLKERLKSQEEWLDECMRRILAVERELEMLKNTRSWYIPDTYKWTCNETTTDNT